MDDQRNSPEGEVPLSVLLAPSYSLRLVRGPISPEGWTIYRHKFERDDLPAAKKRMQAPVDAEDYPAALQIFYVKLAAMHGDWRAMRGTLPTARMIDLFVTARAKYLAWQRRRDEQDEREAALPKSWFEIEPGHWVHGANEESARAFADSMKTRVAEHHTRERPEIEIDTSKTCPRCKMRRVEPGTALCGNCIRMEEP